MNYPAKIIDREPINGLTGIKSSLSEIRKVISLVYLLYLVSGKKNRVTYCKKSGVGKIVFDQELLSSINEYLGQDMSESINNNPLMTTQFEPLYVGLAILLKLAKISMDVISTSERTGGKRYPKTLYFSTNMILLDLIMEGYEDEKLKECLIDWLNNKQADDVFENRISKFISVCTQNTIFKVRKVDGVELFFQTEGVYKTSLLKGDVTIEDVHETVGPNRIYKSIIRENLEPYLVFKNKNIIVRDGKVEDAKEFYRMIETCHEINNVESGLTNN